MVRHIREVGQSQSGCLKLTGCSLVLLLPDVRVCAEDSDSWNPDGPCQACRGRVLSTAVLQNEGLCYRTVTGRASRLLLMLTQFLPFHQLNFPLWGK